jgi:Xaa-Pro aminopeptidase
MNASIFAARRARLARMLADHGGDVAVLRNAPERTRNADSHYPYRHDSHFHYLTGFDEPDAWLVLRSDGHCTLFCRPSDAEREMWEGRRLGVDAAPAALGVDRALPIEALAAHMPQALAQASAVWCRLDSSADADTAVQAQVESWLPAAHPPLRDAHPLVSEMRLIKDLAEQATMRRAAAISADAHVRAMRYCATRFRGGAAALHEYEIEAELLHEFRRRGAQSPAYASIVAAGANACVLHHPAGASALQPGELCLVDAGCEVDGYASDISRTFPANGRFSTPQRALYEVVLEAQQQAIAATRPGRRQRDAHHAAVRVLSQGLLDLGLLSRDAHGSVDDVIATAAYRRFYMHGTGHWLGRDVHDVGAYTSLTEADVAQPDGKGGTAMKPPSRVLVPGMLVTVEPGLYVRPAADVPACYWNIGIRIEDDALVTDAGCELISRGAPVAVADIEACMRG